MRHWFRALVPLLLALALVGCGAQAGGWHARNISGALPRLEFTLFRANDGHEVTAEAYRGDVVLLYFGYTHCPDICPTTLANLAQLLQGLGPRAAHVRVLFVTVDPGRDRPAVLKEYVQAFAPQMDGLFGTANQIAMLARRYRVAYSVQKASVGHPYEVNHSAAVFFFDQTGRSRLVTLKTDDVAGLTADVERLLAER